MNPKAIHVPGHLSFDSSYENCSFFSLLREKTPWEQRVGRMGPAPRLVAWYGECAYDYSGIHHPASPMPDWIEYIRKSVEELASKFLDSKVTFGGVLLNLYRTGSDSVAWHSDDEPEMGEVIASVSFGDARKFKLREKSNHKNVLGYSLEEGDVLFMYQDCQTYWEHCIPKTKKPVGERINLTFRQLV